MKKILIFGSILAVTLLILASLPSVVSATESSPQHQIKDLVYRLKEHSQYTPGYILAIVIYLLMGLLYVLLYIWTQITG